MRRVSTIVRLKRTVMGWRFKLKHYGWVVGTKKPSGVVGPLQYRAIFTYRRYRSKGLHRREFRMRDKFANSRGGMYWLRCGRW